MIIIISHLKMANNDNHLAIIISIIFSNICTKIDIGTI